MSFTSYAQNYEDVMLIRALCGIEHGFYIDVGAQDPVEHSVTKAFYEFGWRGINIEPVKHWFDRLVADRSHDLNLQLAASDKPGRLHLYEITDTGLSTTNFEFAERHAKAGFSVGEIEVDCLTLNEICEKYLVELVHFLKIDCEGAEAAVLSGFSLTDVRPWIILVEATEPLSQAPTYTKWESLLTQRSYHFVYGDGLNRFYVADEHGELDEAFSHPPNVFDDFVRAPDALARQQLEAAQGELRVLRDVQRVERTESEAEHLRAGVEYLRSENERREAALVEQRRQLGDAAAREAVAAAEIEAERAQRRIDLDFLGSENERREAALVEQRRQLEEIAARAAAAAAENQAEREQLQKDLNHLSSENERREGALVELRRLLTEAGERAASTTSRIHVEREQWRLELENLRKDAERRNLALIAKGEVTVALESRLATSVGNLALAAEQSRSLRNDLGRCEDELASLRLIIKEAVTETSELKMEVGRLHHEVLFRDQEISKLSELIQRVQSSISWRVTAPLRFGRRAVGVLSRMVLKVIYLILRWPFRLVRPLLRRMARWPWLSSLVVGVVGHNSWLAIHARLFLFGATTNSEIEEMRAVASSVEPMTKQATRVLEEIQVLRRNRRWGVCPPSSRRK